jgi:hypothetical protein
VLPIPPDRTCSAFLFFHLIKKWHLVKSVFTLENKGVTNCWVFV